MPKSADTVVALQPGRRAANKQEKLARIRRAAREVFLRKGFEGATVREIAAAADVAFGTLFLYAKNKQDLLLLLFDEELGVVAERACRKPKPEMPFVEQLIAFLAEFYTFFSRTPQLSRDMLREVTFSGVNGGGVVAKRVWIGERAIEQHVARLVAAAQANGHVNSSIAPDMAAHVIFSLHRIEVRFCLDEVEPNVARSLDKLRLQFELLLSGLAPRAVASVGETSSLPIRKRSPRRER